MEEFGLMYRGQTLVTLDSDYFNIFTVTQQTHPSLTDLHLYTTVLFPTSEPESLVPRS